MTRTVLVVLLVLVTVGSTALASSPGYPGVDPNANGLAQETTTRESTEEYPPGLSAEGVTDPLALADAHRDALSNTSYAMTTTSTFQRPNGSILSQGTTTTRVAAGASSFSVVSSRSEWNDSRPVGVGTYETAAWANETHAVTARQFYDEEPTYEQVTRDDAVMEPDAQWDLLYSTLAATNTSVVNQFERDGETLFRVVSSAQPGEDSAYADRGGYSLVAIVDSEGVVRTLQTTYRTTFDEEPAVVSRTMHVTNLGNTTVERPDWYGQAVGNESENGTA